MVQYNVSFAYTKKTDSNNEPFLSNYVQYIKFIVIISIYLYIQCFHKANYYGGVCKFMNDLLYKLLPMILSLAISQITYLKIDKKYNMTNRISLKLHIKQEWMAFFSFCFTLIIMLIIGILGIYIIYIPPTAYFILCGIMTGIVVGMNNK